VAILVVQAVPHYVVCKLCPKFNHTPSYPVFCKLCCVVVRTCCAQNNMNESHVISFPICSHVSCAAWWCTTGAHATPPTIASPSPFSLHHTLPMTGVCTESEDVCVCLFVCAIACVSLYASCMCVCVCTRLRVCGCAVRTSK